MTRFSCRLHLFAALALLGGIGAGCASLASVQERYVACSYDIVWESALDAMKHYPVTAPDKAKGLIETGWVETLAQGRPYGLFNRQGLPEKERGRLLLNLDRLNDVTVVQLSEIREHWGFRGGARLYQWYPIEPSQEALGKVMANLTAHLEAQGCVIGS